MPQLEFGFYLSQIFFYLASFGVLSFVVFSFVYPRIESVLAQREAEILEMSADIEATVKNAELIREEIAKCHKDAATDLEALRMKYVLRARDEFDRIVGAANGKFDEAMKEGVNNIDAAVREYEAALMAFAGSVVEQISNKVRSAACGHLSASGASDFAGVDAVNLVS